MSVTTSLLTWPPSTISTTSIVSASVTRMPWTNSPFLPIRASCSSICKKGEFVQGMRVTDKLQQHHVVGEAALEQLLGHCVAAVLDDDGLAVEALDVRQRLGEDMGLVGRSQGGVAHRHAHLERRLYL